MGCNSDYMRQTSEEEFTQQTAQNLVYVLKSLKKPVPKDVLETSQDYYASDENDKLTPQLCSLIKKMTKKQKDTILYNGKNKAARQLAEWWEEHQEADKERVREEKAEKTSNKLRKQALAKLTKAEKKALGL